MGSTNFSTRFKAIQVKKLTGKGFEQFILYQKCPEQFGKYKFPMSHERYTAKIYDAITSLLLHKCCTLNLTTTSLHLIVVYYDLSYSTTTTLQRTVVFSTTFLIYFVVAANCRYNYDDLLYTANMYYYATTYLS